jgi:hypothetical protein
MRTVVELLNVFDTLDVWRVPESLLLRPNMNFIHSVIGFQKVCCCAERPNMNFIHSVIALVRPERSRDAGTKVSRLLVGRDVHLSNINGSVFNCFVLVPIKNSRTHLVKCKYFLAVTECQIAELYPHPSKRYVASTADVHELEDLLKLRFKRGDPQGGRGELVLEYKGGKVLTLMVDSPAACAKCIKDKMEAGGMKGKVSSQLDRKLESAQNCFSQAREIEKQFEKTACLELVREMMQLLRVSAERFEEANAQDYKAVNAFIRAFLSRPDVKAVLESASPHQPPLGACYQQTSSPPSAPLSPAYAKAVPSNCLPRDSMDSGSVSAANAATSAENPIQEHSPSPSPSPCSPCASLLFPIDEEEAAEPTGESGEPADGESGGTEDAAAADAAAADAAADDLAVADASHTVDSILAEDDIDLPCMEGAADWADADVGDDMYVHVTEEWGTGDTWEWEAGEAGDAGGAAVPSSEDPCELSAMLDEMTTEFDAMVQSFSNPGETGTETGTWTGTGTGEMLSGADGAFERDMEAFDRSVKS